MLFGYCLGARLSLWGYRPLRTRCASADQFFFEEIQVERTSTARQTIVIVPDSEAIIGYGFDTSTEKRRYEKQDGERSRRVFSFGSIAKDGPESEELPTTFCEPRCQVHRV